MEQLIFVLLMLFVALVQWLIGKFKGQDEEAPGEQNREEWQQQMEQQRAERARRRGETPGDGGGGPQQPAGDSEQEAYRRLMEALGIPPEEQRPQEREETPPQPQPQQRREPPPVPSPTPDSTRRRGQQRQEQAEDRPYVTRQRTWRDQENQRQEVLDKAEREVETARRETRKQAPTGGLPEIDSRHLERTEVGTQEIGSGAEIGHKEAEFSWDIPTTSRQPTGFGGMGTISSGSAYSIRTTGPIRRVSRGEVLAMLRDRESLKKGIILREILGPPKALQDPRADLYYQNH